MLRIIFAFCVFGGLCFAWEMRILPINQAKFLVGQKFDFLVEMKNAPKNPLAVSINGVKAEEFFRKTPYIWEENGILSYRINEVSFEKEGEFVIKAQSGQVESLVHYEVVQPQISKNAKNVILLIGDGMSLQAKQMARILSKGIVEGKYKDVLAMENLDRMALITTSGYDSLTTDSANSASAYATGHKSVVGAIGIYENATKDPFDDPKVENLTEILKRSKKMQIGIVTTASVTDATPAAFISHTRQRFNSNRIALDLLESAPDVLLGGGLRYFIPKSQANSRRDDERNLIQELKDKGYNVVFNQKELLSKSKYSDKLAGFFHYGNLNVFLDREILKNDKVLKDFDNQPSLVEMTEIALQKLSQSPNGFFLLVEAASIDKQLHNMDWQRATYDTIELDKAVAKAMEFAKNDKNTLVIVVADHAHGASITGTYHEKDGKTGREAVRVYGRAVFPTFEDKNGDGYPDNPNPEVTLAVQYANHPDYKANYHLREIPVSPTKREGHKYIANPHSNGEEYKGNIPESELEEVHAADDVILMADGVGSEYFKGVMDNTEVFFGIIRALDVEL
ncbi:alkaline phosphatase [Helicobacter monodelphidis]|uniref:alkaline phosphatase n=1 Tax=Helicobacter sp. 15-1451 TaxID=2004995 RepID=UPI000DCEF771|nr:alkaline phosphatase [Helicobacter sp. 15-1451]RAX57176.1 alkaline phosphatase [Helicobacter sp. 15-1451]